MPYREKVAWLSLAAIALTFGPFFTYLKLFPPGDALPNLRLLGIFAAVVTVQVMILAIGHILLRTGAPQDARLPLDERDRAIMYRARSAAYYVLIAGVCLAGVTLPFYADGWRVISASLFMIVLAEVVHYGVIVFNYRRQS